MKLANGMGSVYKQGGKRRNPWIARKLKDGRLTRRQAGLSSDI